MSFLAPLARIAASAGAAAGESAGAAEAAGLSEENVSRLQSFKKGMDTASQAYKKSKESSSGSPTMSDITSEVI